MTGIAAAPKATGDGGVGVCCFLKLSVFLFSNELMKFMGGGLGFGRN